jgi:transcription initiation factor TFIIIB Brf1 subunit/transcription initiation factor TFIIB
MASLFFSNAGKRQEQTPKEQTPKEQTPKEQRPKKQPTERSDDLWLLFELPKPVAREGPWCQECDTADNIHVEKEEMVCYGCGTSMGFNIDSSAEYRYYGADGRDPDPTRVGHPINPYYPESSSGTRILQRMGESKAMRRIRQYHSWNIMPYNERSLWGVFDLLHIRCTQAGISMAIEEETKQVYAQVSPLRIWRGVAKEAIMGACLYESLKRHGVPWRPAEVAAVLQIDSKLITKGSKQLSELLEEHSHSTANTLTEMPEEEEKITHSTGFQHYLEPAMSRLETPRAKHGAILEFGTRMGHRINKVGMVSETTPSSLAASAMVLTCEHFGLEKTTTEIAKVCSISTATLQKCLKRIAKWRPLLFSEKEI